MTVAFAGVGTALVVTQPDESFVHGLGVGNLIWSAATAAQTVVDIVMMKRARRFPRAKMRATTSLWLSRFNVVASSGLTAGGLGAMIAGLAIDGKREMAGEAATFAMYGAGLLVFSLVNLVQIKRQIRKCTEICPAPALGGTFAIRF